MDDDDVFFRPSGRNIFYKKIKIHIIYLKGKICTYVSVTNVGYHLFLTSSQLGQHQLRRAGEKVDHR